MTRDKPGLLRWACVFEWFSQNVRFAHRGNKAVPVSFVVTLGRVLKTAIDSDVFGNDPLLRHFCETFEHAHAQVEDEDAVMCGLAMELILNWLRIVAPQFGKGPLPLLAHLVHGLPTGELHEHPNLSCWLADALEAIAQIIRQVVARTPLTPLQITILRVLDETALHKEDLAAAACGSSDYGNILYRPGGVKELIKLGLVVRDHRGFFRPDRPPKSLNC